MKKFIKRIIASVGCLAMLSTVNVLDASASIICDQSNSDNSVGNVYNLSDENSTIDITLNNGETFTLTRWDYVLRDDRYNDDENIVGYISYTTDGTCTIYKGELYKGYGVFNRDDDYNICGTYECFDIVEKFPQYNLPEHVTNIYFDLDGNDGKHYGNYDGYSVTEFVFNEEEITLPTGKIITVPEESNTIVYRFNSDGTLRYYDWGISSVPCYDVENDITIGESEDTIGDSTEIIGESDTGIRGDINYDGKVNVSDLIYLRRYLLHLIKW